MPVHNRDLCWTGGRHVDNKGGGISHSILAYIYFIVYICTTQVLYIFYVDLTFPSLIYFSLFQTETSRLTCTICLLSCLVHFSSVFSCFTLALLFSSGLTSSTTPTSPESSEDLGLFLLSRRTSKRIIITAIMAANTKPNVAGNP